MPSTTLQTNTIESLPNEVLIKVFKDIKGHSTAQLLPCLLVCKGWKSLAEPVAWDSIQITDENLTRFLEYKIISNHKFGSVRHLSIAVCAYYPDMVEDWYESASDAGHGGCSRQPRQTDESKGANKLGMALKLLACVVEVNMRSILTHSLVIYNRPYDGLWCGCHTSRMPESLFERYLKALPPSCQYLELDTGGTDFGTEIHICNEIRQLLPQLKSLRLRLAQICPLMLVEKATLIGSGVRWEPPAKTHLVECDINLDISPNPADPQSLTPQDANAKLCHYYNVDAQDGTEAELDYQKPGIQLAKCFQAAVRHSDALLDLQKCNIIEVEDYGRNVQLNYDLCAFAQTDQIAHFDVIANKTYCLPLQQFAYPNDSTAQYIRDFKGCLLKDRCNKALFGSMNEFEAMIENGWYTTESGARRPPRIKNTTGVGANAKLLMRDHIIDQETFEERYRVELRNGVDAVEEHPDLGRICRAIYLEALQRRPETFEGCVMGEVV